MTTYTESAVDAAMCLWEAYLDNIDDPLWKKWRERWGTATLRGLVLDWGQPCSDDWDALQEVDEDAWDWPFDWEFCPAWLRACVDWDNPAQPSMRLTDERRRIMRVFALGRG